MLAYLLSLIPAVYVGFGRLDQPSGLRCSQKHERLDAMDVTGSLQWANEVGARANTPACLSTV